MTQKAIIFSLLICITTYSFGQKVKDFGDDPDKYPEIVADMFSSNTSNKDLDLISQFAGEWANGAFTGNEKTQIIQLSNAFMEKKARNIHYLALWHCLLTFKWPDNASKGYDVWMKGMHALCQNRRTTPTVLHSIMVSTQNLLAENIIISSVNSEWKSSNDDFRYELTDNELTAVFGTTDIYCFAKGDSIIIGQTAGRFQVTEQLWRGKGGLVTWERAGYASGDVFAKLGDYRIDMKKTEYQADSVWLTHKTYFPSPVLGKLTDRVRHNQSLETAIYPEFVTYNKKFVFDDLYPGISYEGGISIQGARTVGSGSDEEKASLKIEKGDSIRFDIYSKNFVFRNDRINSRKVSVVIRLKEDSIYHSNLSFTYLVDSKEVSLLRSDAATSQAPYSNSYHKMELNFEQLIWKMNDPLISMSMSRGAAVGNARFRSQNYFDERYFEQMQYFDVSHPLVQIRKCAVAYSETFSSEIYATFIKRPLATARTQLIEIAKLGFITYDGDTDEITVQPRLYEFLSAAAKRADFDVIDLQSTVRSPEKNAQLDTRNYDLIINGLEKFMVSDSQNVVLTPRNKKIVMKKNRSIDMDGRIDAGQLEMYGDSLHFDYNAFQIGLYQVDSLFFYVPTGETDRFGKPRLRKVKNAVEKLSGSILIDEPDNKSGRKSILRYPILKSDSSSFVFYGSSDIEGGAYDSESFYFEIDPFVLDSIDDFNKKSLVLPGSFASAEIFSEMRQELRVQPDYSLGFVYETGDSSLSAFKDAKLSAEVRLSNKGLQASGQLDYLTATILTDEFKIYPDSMNVPFAKEFKMRKQMEEVEFPEVSSEGNRIHWEPKIGKMNIYKHEKAFNMYNPETNLDGDLLLTPKGLSGTGRMDIGRADLRSAHIDFKGTSFSSDTSSFRLKGKVDGTYQFLTLDSVRTVIDFVTRKGSFDPARDYALVQFPYNKFAAHVDKFSWDMDSSDMRIGVDTLLQKPKPAVPFRYQQPGEGMGARYYSTSLNADSLNFVASSAVFDGESGRLKTEGVKLVRTADALVYPHNGKITIDTDGKLETLEQARIVFSNETKQHIIHSATVDIFGRKQYIGRGKYNYVDETGKISEIEMASIAPDKAYKTVANGTITEELDFMLSPFYRYQGKVSLSSDATYMAFDGTAQIIEECGNLNPGWFSFQSVIDPKDIKIPVNAAPVGLNNTKIYNGIFLTNDSTHIYPALFSRRKNYSDNQLVTAEGVLQYDKGKMIYYISSEEKLKNRALPGNLIAFNRDECMLNGEGKLSLGVDLGQVQTDVVGQITHNLNNRETSLDVMVSFDFPFDEGLAAMIAAKIDSFPTLAGVDMTVPRFVNGLNEWLGMSKAATYSRDALLGKVKNFPAELKHTLVLTELKLNWVPANRSYRSVGKIGVGNLFGHQVNRLVEGVVEISKRPGGDFLDIYLKIDENNWFYFGYTRELMQIISSDQNFNDRLMKLPEKQRKNESKRPGYTYMIASGDKLSQFLKQNQQLNTSSPSQPAPLIEEISTPVIPQEVNNENEPPIREVE